MRNKWPRGRRSFAESLKKTTILLSEEDWKWLKARGEIGQQIREMIAEKIIQESVASQ